MARKTTKKRATKKRTTKKRARSKKKASETPFYCSKCQETYESWPKGSLPLMWTGKGSMGGYCADCMSKRNPPVWGQNTSSLPSSLKSRTACCHENA